jgi:tetratricopeptide (TPR) repeat protein
MLFFATSILFAESVDKKFKEANDFYKKNKFNEAIAEYNEILDKGFESADLYYNLGNAYFKAGKIADAILFYERAKRLAPEDEDIDFNLRIANLKIVDKFNEVPKLFFIEWYENIYGMFSSDSWAVLIIIFSFLTFTLLLGYFLIWNILARKVFFFGASIGLLLLIASILFAIEQSRIEETRDSAIIFSPSVYIKSSPDKTSTDLFILHEGAKVKILDEVGGWKKIRIADGNVGWLPNKTIEVI